MPIAALPIWLQTTLFIATVLVVIIFVVSVVVTIHRRIKRTMEAHQDAARIVETIANMHSNYHNRFMPVMLRCVLVEAYEEYQDIRADSAVVWTGADLNASIRAVNAVISRIKDAQEASLINLNAEKERQILNREEAESSDECRIATSDIDEQFARDLRALKEARDRKVQIIDGRQASNLGRINRLRQDLLRQQAQPSS